MAQYDKQNKGVFYKNDIYDMMYPTMYRLVIGLRKKKNEENSNTISSEEIFSEVEKIAPENIFQALLKNEKGFESLLPDQTQ
jgi:hypothetical protein